MEKIYGINPVREIIKSGKHVDVLYVQNNKKNKFTEILELAKERKINVKTVPIDFFDRELSGLNHQGIAASVNTQSHPVLSEEELFLLEGKVTVLILDGITDPHNLGAILRSSDVFGVNAVVMPRDNSVRINDTVFKTSSGAAAYVPSCTVTNIARTLEKLKENGYWIYGTDSENGKSPRSEKFAEKTAVVIGSEGKGMRRIIAEHCDVLLTIPSTGHVDSLNASNAAAVILYEIFSSREI